LIKIKFKKDCKWAKSPSGPTKQYKADDVDTIHQVSGGLAIKNGFADLFSGEEKSEEEKPRPIPKESERKGKLKKEKQENKLEKKEQENKANK